MSFGGGPMTPGVKKLVFICVGIFLLQALVARLVSWNMLTAFLGLIPVLVWKKFFIWQLGTYIFLHGGLFHLFFNMFALWMFGSQLERQWGTRKFIKYFLVTGIGAGIFYAIIRSGQIIPVVGASGAIYGILLAYGMTFPDQLVYVWFLFPMKAKYFVIIFGAIELYASIAGAGGGVANLAHLGGMLFGYLYINYVRIWKGLYLFYLKFKLRRVRGNIHIVRTKKDRDENHYVH
jgi:membrane associated rhomboid family serine protease